LVQSDQRGLSNLASDLRLFTEEIKLEAKQVEEQQESELRGAQDHLDQLRQQVQ
jgi:hypothetical protein